ncbi:MAG TPA: NAD(P)H-dependent oxidoreductase [Acetobacteraceae bacterium]|nr:NAD(P)H-dependent oxidoreductase [Acetobacteraceae bacterium]
MHEVPLYNEDDDGEHAPAAVRALRSAIALSDGVIMVSPEYNHGMSGVGPSRSARRRPSCSSRAATRPSAWTRSN